MIACGNCGKKHEDLEAVRACHQGEKVPSFASSAPRQEAPPDPNRIVTTHCRKLICDKTFTAPLAEAAGWACSPEHGATTTTTKINWEVGARAIYNGKRFEILEITNDGIRLRTGGQGKIVPTSELQPA